MKFKNKRNNWIFGQNRRSDKWRIQFLAKLSDELCLVSFLNKISLLIGKNFLLLWLEFRHTLKVMLIQMYLHYTYAHMKTVSWKLFLLTPFLGYCYPWNLSFFLNWVEKLIIYLKQVIFYIKSHVLNSLNMQRVFLLDTSMSVIHHYMTHGMLFLLKDKWRNKLFSHNISLTWHKKVLILIFVLFWDWRSKAFVKGSSHHDIKAFR